MSKELVKKEETAVAAFEAPEFETEAINVEDIAFPRIQLLQPISESVVEQKYSAGVIIDSVTGEVIGDVKKQVEIIPLRARKYYKVSKLVGQKKEFVRTEPINTRADMDRPWSFEENGDSMVRRPVMECFVLIPGRELPYIFRIAGMSYKGMSKAFYTSAFALPASQKKAPFVRSLLINSKVEKNTKGTYFVYSFCNGKLTDAETYALANQWYESTKHAKVREDNDSDDEQSSRTSHTSDDVGF